MHRHNEKVVLESQAGTTVFERKFRHSHPAEESPHTHRYGWVGMSTKAAEAIFWEGKTLQEPRP